MADRSHLEATLSRIDGRAYRGYRDLSRYYEMGAFDLAFDQIQADPFAAPSRVRLRVPISRLGFMESDVQNPVRRRALADFLARRISRACDDLSQRRGSGSSGVIRTFGGGQEVLDRAAVVFADHHLQVRLRLGLPAQGRRVLGRQAQAMLCDDLQRLVDDHLPAERHDETALKLHLDGVEDSQALREQLHAQGLVAFVANGALLPRRHGEDPRPMLDGLPFQSPKSLEVTLKRPHGRPLRGMGLPAGISVIVGGGYHGKSTLLQALANGIYDHIPGDGREHVVTPMETVKIRAEEGRPIHGIDISPFVRELPGGRSTDRFETEDASGSTSQAGNIQESLEAGARVLLLDEDSSATNFMIRDARMQALIPGDKEPIIPFVDRVQQLRDDLGVSTIMVMGGSGDYLEFADCVIGMDQYQAWDARELAGKVALDFPNRRPPRITGSMTLPNPRRIDGESMDPSRGRRAVSIRHEGVRAVLYGEARIDLSSWEQIVDPGQTLAIGYALERLRRVHLKESKNLAAALESLAKEMSDEGVDVLSTTPPRGELVAVRSLDVAAALNRLRGLIIS